MITSSCVTVAERDDDADAIPEAAAVLGAVGILPLLAGTFITVLAPSALGLPVRQFTLVYAAIIVSFLGGIHWGFASAAMMHQVRDKRARTLMRWSVLPTLASWLSVLLSGAASPLLLAASFILALFLDRTALRRGFAPLWWLRMRIRLTVAVVPLLLTLALGQPLS